MSHDLVQKRRQVSVFVMEPLTADRATGAVVLTATAADIKYAFAPSTPIEVYRFGVLAKAAVSAAGMVLTLGRTADLNALGSPTNFATLTLTALAANKGAYRNVDTAVAQSVGVDGSLVNVKVNGPMLVRPGEAAIITLTTVASVSGTGYLFIEYVEKDGSGPEFTANMTKVTT